MTGTGSEADSLREEFRRRVSASSLRSVAREAGLNHATAWKLLRGAAPRPSTLAKLRAWHEGHRLALPEEEALETMLGRLPEPARAATGKMIRTVLRLRYEEAGLGIPAWLQSATSRSRFWKVRRKGAKVVR